MFLCLCYTKDMKLELGQNLDEIVLGEALRNLPDGGEILQSGVWRDIVEAEGKKVWRLVWLDDKKAVGLAQVLESSHAGFKIWYLPRGPLCLQTEKAASIWLELKLSLVEFAKDKGVMLVRFEPENWPITGLDFGQKIKDIQPSHSLFLNLKQTEDELLSAMHPKTRYNIRLAEKKEVLIVRGGEDDLQSFWKLLQATTSRDGFRGHSLEHYRKLLKYSHGTIELWLAKREEKVLAAGIFSFYEGRAVYLHGASSDADRQYMAPHLLQWKMIIRAREKACLYYDFYGIDEKKWPGVTRFKKGFGGEDRYYAGTFNLIILNYQYTIFRTMSWFLDKWRRLLA